MDKGDQLFFGKDGGRKVVDKNRIRVVFGCLCGGLKMRPKKLKKGDEDGVGGGWNGA